MLHYSPPVFTGGWRRLCYNGWVASVRERMTCISQRRRSVFVQTETRGACLRCASEPPKRPSSGLAKSFSRSIIAVKYHLPQQYSNSNSSGGGGNRVSSFLHFDELGADFFCTRTFFFLLVSTCSLQRNVNTADVRMMWHLYQLPSLCIDAIALSVGSNARAFHLRVWGKCLRCIASANAKCKEVRKFCVNTFSNYSSKHCSWDSCNIYEKVLSVI